MVAMSEDEIDMSSVAAVKYGGAYKLTRAVTDSMLPTTLRASRMKQMRMARSVAPTIATQDVVVSPVSILASQVSEEEVYKQVSEAMVAVKDALGRCDVDEACDELDAGCNEIAEIEARDWAEQDLRSQARDPVEDITTDYFAHVAAFVQVFTDDVVELSRQSSWVRAGEKAAGEAFEHTNRVVADNLALPDEGMDDLFSAMTHS